jgi:hypothetical protein
VSRNCLAVIREPLGLELTSTVELMSCWLPIMPNNRSQRSWQINELVAADRGSEWRGLKALVLDSVSSPITRRVYNLGLDEFIAWFTEEPRPAGFTKATVTAWRVALEARKLGPISINVRITAVRKLAVERPITDCWRRNWRRGSRE